MSNYCRPSTFIGDPIIDSMNEIIQLEPKPFGHLRLWCQVDLNGMPVLAAGDEYVIGIDISAGSGASNSAMSIAHKATGEKIGEYTHKKLMPHEFAAKACAIGNLFCHRFGSLEWQTEPAFMLWESNGPGLIFGSVLVRDFGYRNVHYRTKEDTVLQKHSDTPGWHSSTANKMRLLGEYRKALGTDFVNHSKEAHKECLQFIYDGENVVHSKSINTLDPSASRSNHGDRVIADALCWKGIKERREAPDETKEWNPEPPQNSFGARQNEWQRQQREAVLY
jgi:hypothetical protein